MKWGDDEAWNRKLPPPPRWSLDTDGGGGDGGRRIPEIRQRGSWFWHPLDEEPEEDEEEEGRLNAWNDSWQQQPREELFQVWQQRRDWLIVFVAESGWLNGGGRSDIIKLVKPIWNKL